MSFVNYDKAQSEMASIAEAYLQLVEKRHKKEDKPTETDVEKVAKELEKVADELKEAFVLLLEQDENGKVRVSPEKVKELQRKAEEFRNSITPEDMAKWAEFSANHQRQKEQRKGLEEALMEALTDTDFEGKAKVASTSQDANLLAALAQSHMAGDVAGATDICNHVARNPATPKHVLEKLAKHSDPKVRESAENNLTARDSQINESLLDEAYGMGNSLDDDYVARQFAAGKPARRKSAHTDGKIYWLHGNEIARQMGEPGKMEFSWAGWYTPTTERHLNTILKQVAPGKSVQKSQHKHQGIERFTLDHFKAPDPGPDAEPHPAA